MGAENVILGGLSQGCAAALVATLLWNGEPLAAVFGMCGWLPYRAHMQAIAETTAAENADEEDEDDPFAHQAEAGEWFRIAAHLEGHALAFCSIG